MLSSMPRDAPGLKPHKTPPMSELVENPDPIPTASEYERRSQERQNRIGGQLATYRRPKAAPPKGDA